MQWCRKRIRRARGEWAWLWYFDQKRLQSKWSIYLSILICFVCQARGNLMMVLLGKERHILLPRLPLFNQSETMKETLDYSTYIVDPLVDTATTEKTHHGSSVARPSIHVSLPAPGHPSTGGSSSASPSSLFIHPTSSCDHEPR